MIDIRSVLQVDDVRALQFRLFSDKAGAYLRSGPFGIAVDREVEQRIRNVKGSRIRRILDAVAAFDESEVRPAWSQFMAVGAGTHPWPDGNHRTAFLSFNLALQRATGLNVLLSPERAGQMIAQSKALRDRDRLARRPARYYTVEDLASPAHPYRRLFAGYEGDLIIKPA